MFTELIELGHKMKQEMKSTQTEKKQNIQRINSEGKETGTQVNDLEQKEEINIQLKQNEETRIKKMRKGLGTYGTTLNIPISKSQRCQKEKNNSKKLKTYLNKYEGKVPQSSEGNRLPGSPGSPESPKEIGPKEKLTKAHHD